MKSISTIKVLIFAIASLVIGCRENIDYTFSGTTKPHLVVEGYLTTDKTRHKVVLSKMGDPLMKDSILFVSSALVSISDGTATFNLAEDQSNKGTYLTNPDVAGVVGRTYTLRIKNVDIDNDKVMEEYSAQSSIKSLNPIDSIHIVYSSFRRDSKGWTINLFSMDPGNGRNFYLIKVLKNNVLLTDSIFKYSTNDNSGFEGQYFDGFPVYQLNEERKDEKLSTGDRVTVEMCGIDENYYSFITSYITDYYPKVPIFSGPSANIPTNIIPLEKSAGIFAAYSIQRKTVIYK